MVLADGTELTSDVVAKAFLERATTKYGDPRTCFDAFDRRKLGAISRSDFKRGLRQMGFDLSDDLRAVLRRLIDKEDTKRITFSMLQSFITGIPTLSRRSSIQYDINAEPPEAFFCPITHGLMKDPCVAADGHTYERNMIEAWIKGHRTSPITNLELEHQMIIPNLVVKSLIAEWVESHPKRFTLAEATASASEVAAIAMQTAHKLANDALQRAEEAAATELARSAAAQYRLALLQTYGTVQGAFNAISGGGGNLTRSLFKYSLQSLKLDFSVQSRKALRRELNPRDYKTISYETFTAFMCPRKCGQCKGDANLVSTQCKPTFICDGCDNQPTEAQVMLCGPCRVILCYSCYAQG